MDDNHVEYKRIVFVTVGTTSFDSLVKTVDSRQVKEALSAKGYTHLVIQMGRGSYIPKNSSGEDGSLVVDCFTFSSSIADYLRSASLVISHAGSGSIFETLRLAKPLIVVVNEDLMDNHQSELAEELSERKHLFCARPQTLCEVIKSLRCCLFFLLENLFCCRSYLQASAGEEVDQMSSVCKEMRVCFFFYIKPLLLLLGFNTHNLHLHSLSTLSLQSAPPPLSPPPPLHHRHLSLLSLYSLSLQSLI
ncbi:putative N-acetylglucosaminyldiphosphodolichol N-acetylglucosaminyltransferase [Helianthus annuus]|nr:putative N-acetylglucosaminyldiphosphodolichol N-acetylglucosaminyltransferase [Helianthus annuus]